MKSANILLEGKEQDKIRGKVSKIVENYDSFVLVEVTDEQIAELEKEGYKVLIQDDIGRIQIGDAIIDTDTARYDENGSILPHPSYESQKDFDTGMHHYIIQFIGPIKEEWIKNIENLGGVLGAPYPSHSYIIELDEDIRNKVVNLPYVRWVGHYDLAYRVTSDTLETNEKPEFFRKVPKFRQDVQRVSGTYYVSFHTRNNMEDALSTIENLGATVNTVPDVRKTITVTFPDEMQLSDKLKQLSSMHGVRSIEPVHIRKIMNNVATQIMSNNSTTSTMVLPLTGKTETIAVADTGLDTGDPVTIHKDFRGRIKGITSWPIAPSLNHEVLNPGADDGPADKDSGHGTHVTGSVLGNGAMSSGMAGGPIRGFAYEAQLFFQAIEQIAKFPQNQTEYALLGIPDDLTQLFQQAYAAGARIHTNSWGGGKAGIYDEQCKSVDKFTWDHKDIVVLYAAGNDGSDINRDGKIEFGSISPPATAKNCISVGASENLRENINVRYYDVRPDEFPKAPIALDKMADNPDDIAGFSSRGPCGDGRFKPDIVAPGTFILSTKSSKSTGKGFGIYNQYYFYDCGTSMATPLTAGAVALIRQYLGKNLNASPSSALVRAAIIHTALRRSYKYSTAPGGGLWDPEQGWGHVNLKPFVQPPSNWQMKFIDVNKGLQTGQSQNYEFQVKDASSPVKITLVWNDAPAGNYYPALINNLDLIVTDPKGNSYHGNVFTAPYDKTTDKINNVEVVSIQKPITGKYKVMVLASEVKKGPQDFALVYSGNI